MVLVSSAISEFAILKVEAGVKACLARASFMISNLSLLSLKTTKVQLLEVAAQISVSEAVLASGFVKVQA
tara:strand:- start:295 stop:504 length:210 start_codon:yes stop_codon:yes gene_type:complete